MLHKEGPSFLSKAQTEDALHSGFRALIAAVQASRGGYTLESADKLFGEKSAKFREVSTGDGMAGP